MTGRPLVVRDARPEDLAEVSRVLADSYAQYARPADADWDAYARDVADVWSRAEHAELIVAERGGRLVGAVTFYPDGSRSLERWPPGWAGIRLLGVLPGHRGTGIGRALTEECLRRARAAGARTVGLHTTDRMAVAKAMYERMGFVRAPDFDFDAAPTVRVIGYRLELR